MGVRCVYVRVHAATVHDDYTTATIVVAASISFVAHSITAALCCEVTVDQLIAHTTDTIVAEVPRLFPFCPLAPLAPLSP
jgi:hypothetical protein